jgi:hypothetical protein
MPRFPIVVAYPIEDPISPAPPWSEEDFFLKSHTTLLPRRDLYTVVAFDEQTRRWYNIVSEHETPEDVDALEDLYWVDILRQTEPRTKSSSEFNRIFVEQDGSLSLSTVTPAEAGFHTIYPLSPPPSVAEHTPNISISDISARQFLWASAELAEWQGKKFVFKQILDRTDAPRLSIEAEILISLRLSPFFPNIEAFVIDEQGMMRGFLLPFLGTTIDSKSVETLPLPFFRDLFLAMSDLERICKRPHGDLFARNILVSEDGKLTIIDVGNAGCDYPGDRQALADLLVDADILKKIPSDAERKAVAWAWDKLQENWAYPSIAQGLLPDDGTLYLLFSISH